ncbi:MAG: site-2 protease family protein [Rickettsiales bacterium]|nr:site-2 protease family protein [Rickettsiales bacterium]|tara:strand:+ start:568 stop:1380 length:813 start_codon:yes stop_codon:yes gene_type:complete
MITILLLSKFKWLLAGLKLMKFGSLFTMLLTIWVYSNFFGWPFAVGFVLLILVHEYGHLLAMRHQNIPTGAPVFIPFVGAVIAMKGRPRDAFVEAIVGIGGPALGGLGALGCLLAALASDSLFFYALASTGFLLNLFNMLPVSPLDGGRITGAISRWLWVAGYAVGIPLLLITGSPILGLILLLGLLTIWRTWKRPVQGYYSISRGRRMAIAAGYFGLLAALTLGMSLADLPLQQLSGTQAAALYSGALLPGLQELLAGKLPSNPWRVRQ